MSIRYYLLTLLLSGVLVSLSAAAETSSPLGRKAAPFTLHDYRGKEVALADFQKSKLVVVAFLGTECPLVRLYGSRLAELAQEYEPKGVAFVGINANVQDSITEMAAYARRHNIGFPILKDTGNKVADQFGAERTPEIFVLDGQRAIRYRGRVDDQYGISHTRKEPRRRDLKIALDELLAGKTVSQPITRAEGCVIGRVREVNAASKITYSKHIAPILQNRCVECHRDGQIAPFALTEYDEVKGWAEMIAEVVRDQRMPPWHANPKYGHFRNARSLTEQEKQLIYQWVDSGAPQGDPKELPEAKEYLTGWELPRQPDVVLNIQEKPFKVKADGEVRYQYFRVDPAFKEDKWFNAAQVLPRQRAVVHHVLVFAVDPADVRGSIERVGGGRNGFLVGYVPGSRVHVLPQGMAMRIPAGHHLVFQVHYTPIGTEVLDQSKLGLWLVEPPSITHEVVVRSAYQQFIKIPPGVPNHKEEATSPPLPQSQLLGFMPHMHLRGKSFRYEIRYPDGKKDIVLDVPQYDFNWQTAYQLTDPIALPAGTRIHCTAHYDNSEDNLSNPNAGQTVYWGDQTWEEMLIGYFGYAVPRDPNRPGATATELPRSEREKIREDAEQLIRKFDKNGNGSLSRLETPLRYQIHFAVLDRNGDGEVTAEEATEAILELKKKKKR